MPEDETSEKDLIKARDALKAECKRFREHLEREMLSVIKKEIEFAEKYKTTADPSNNKTIQAAKELIPYLIYVFNDIKKNDDEIKVSFNSDIIDQNKKYTEGRIVKPAESAPIIHKYLSAYYHNKNPFESTNQQKFIDVFAGSIGEQYVALKELEQHFNKNQNDPKKQIEDFSADFKNKEKLFPKKESKALTHTLASVATLGVYALLRLAHSKYTKKSSSFWKSREELLTDKLEETSKKAKISSKK